MQLRARWLAVAGICALFVFGTTGTVAVAAPSGNGNTGAANVPAQPTTEPTTEAPTQEASTTAEQSSTESSTAAAATSQATLTTTEEPVTPEPALPPTPTSPAPPPASAQPVISISPTSGPPGTTVTVTGSGWSDWFDRGESVAVQSEKGQWVSARPDAQGAFTVQLKIDQNADSGPSWVTAVYGNGSGSSQTFTVTAPAPTETVVITPDPVQAGNTITIVGHGFSPGISVVTGWCFGGQLPDYPIVGDDGSFTFTVTVPADAPVGPTCINMPSHGTYGFAITPHQEAVAPGKQQSGPIEQPPEGGEPPPNGQGQQPPAIPPPAEAAPAAPGQDEIPSQQGQNQEGQPNSAPAGGSPLPNTPGGDPYFSISVPEHAPSLPSSVEKWANTAQFKFLTSEKTSWCLGGFIPYVSAVTDTIGGNPPISDGISEGLKQAGAKSLEKAFGILTAVGNCITIYSGVKPTAKHQPSHDGLIRQGVQGGANALYTGFENFLYWTTTWSIL